MIKVTIICITYNQEKFLRQALDSFLMQKTNFDFEVLVHDDASTDTTTEILRDYEAAHPGIIKPIYETDNQFSIGNMDFINDMLRSAKGQYIAMCEGDDFWTDPEKLQRQVDFLDNNPEYALCFHPVRVFLEGDTTEKDTIFPKGKNTSDFTVNKLLAGNFIQTNSVLFRRQNYEHIPPDLVPGDYYLHLYHAQFGKIGFINRVMAAYRRHPSSLWWESSHNRDKFWQKYAESHLKLYGEILKLYGQHPSKRAIINERVAEVFRAAVGISHKDESSLLKKLITNFPDMTQIFISIQDQELEKAKTIIAHGSPQRVHELEGFLEAANKQSLEMQKERDDLRREIVQMRSSNTFKVAQKLAKLKHGRSKK